jgi:hypothetical protein
MYRHFYISVQNYQLVYRAKYLWINEGGFGTTCNIACVNILHAETALSKCGGFSCHDVGK